jgi:putative ABC transport system permease protein
MNLLSAVIPRVQPIPLAWLQLMNQKLRLAAAVAGIAFAAMMMLMQLGFHDALFKSCTLLHTSLDGDLVVLSSQFDSVISTKSFTRRRLYQALGFPNVESVIPIYLGTTKWTNPDNFTNSDVFVIAFDPATPALKLPGLHENIGFTKSDDVVLFDAWSRSEYGPIPEKLARDGQVITEVSGRRTTVKGLFQLGTSFAADGNIITSDLTFLNLFPTRTSGLIDLGLIRLKPGTDAEKARTAIESTLPRDVQIVTPREFMQMENRYWQERTPIGFVITAGMIVGFVVGSVIVYQILYTDVTDHLKEYATLKAIGYTDGYLYSLVFQEVLILTTLGFVPACVGASGIFSLTRSLTQLPAAMSLSRTALVFALTLVMCSIAGAFATRKLRAADPADIF